MRGLTFLIVFGVFSHSLWILKVDCLKCRKDNLAQEAHFKRVIRSCMRKMSDIGNRKGDMFSTTNGRTDNYQGNNNNNNPYKFNRNFNNSDNNNRNRYNQRDNYYTPTEERYQDRNKYSNSDDYGVKYGSNKNTQNNNNKYNNQQQQQHSDYDRYGPYADDDDVGKYGDQRRSQNQFNIMMSNGQGDQATDSACVVHCFFNELNMLNDQGFPDRNQVNFILTQGTQNRELRSFYTDTVHKCFHYVDSKQHRDRCDYARDIAQCLMEYAKANCEDIQTHNVIFN